MVVLQLDNHFNEHITSQIDPVETDTSSEQHNACQEYWINVWCNYFNKLSTYLEYQFWLLIKVNFHFKVVHECTRNMKRRFALFNAALNASPRSFTAQGTNQCPAIGLQKNYRQINGWQLLRLQIKHLGNIIAGPSFQDFRLKSYGHQNSCALVKLKTNKHAN